MAYPSTATDFRLRFLDAEPDAQGRRQFILTWRDTPHSPGLPPHRGQVFFADPDEVIARHRARGQDVEVA